VHLGFSYWMASGECAVSTHAGTNGKTFWVPPGSGLEGDDTLEQPALREAREELGITCVTLKCALDRETDFLFIDHLVHQHEWFFLIEGARYQGSPPT
jgi:8-oxo-dGTP pyrophosphatase MutT (NUDIX family)